MNTVPPASLNGQWVAIHAGKSKDSLDDVHHLLDAARATFDDPGEAFRVVPERYDIQALPLGAVVAVGRFVAVWRTELVDVGDLGTDHALGNYGPGRWGWQFDPVIPVDPPLLCRGAQGLWEVSPEIERLLKVVVAARVR